MKKGIFLSLVCLYIIAISCFNFNSSSSNQITRDSRPLMTSDLYAPIEQRDFEYVDFLSASVKISANGASGSGTICYYDDQENWAYVISCGHLWSGNKMYFEKKRQKVKIITWYHNQTKLDESRTYEAEVLFYSNKRGYDCSCLRFRPDWSPNYFPIASTDHRLKKSAVLNSLGCDGGGEVARYEVEFVEYRGPDIITRKNSPRPGRSGGGLITDSGWYVGVCWGTSDTVSGGGIGYFTPLDSIHEVFIKNEHEWLVRVGDFSPQDIPVYDWENYKKYIDKDFIPVPAITKSLFFEKSSSESGRETQPLKGLIRTHLNRAFVGNKSKLIVYY